MSQLHRATSDRRPAGAAGSFLAALLLLFVVLGAAFGGSASVVAKPAATPLVHGGQFLRPGGPQARYRAVRDVGGDAIVPQQQRVTDASCFSSSDAAPAHDAPFVSSSARASASPSRVDSQRCRELVLGYLSRAPPATA